MTDKKLTTDDSEFTQPDAKDTVLANLYEYALPNRSLMLDQNGHAVLDDTPLALPYGADRPPTLAEQIARLVKREILDHRNSGDDLPDDDEDWDEDSDQPFSPYELVFDPVLGKEVTAKEFMANQDKYRAKYAQAALEANERDGAIPLRRSSKQPALASPKAKGSRPQEAGEPEADHDDE